MSMSRRPPGSTPGSMMGPPTLSGGQRSPHHFAGGWKAGAGAPGFLISRGGAETQRGKEDSVVTISDREETGREAPAFAVEAAAGMTVVPWTFDRSRPTRITAPLCRTLRHCGALRRARRKAIGGTRSSRSSTHMRTLTCLSRHDKLWRHGGLPGSGAPIPTLPQRHGGVLPGRRSTAFDFTRRREGTKNSSRPQAAFS